MCHRAGFKDLIGLFSWSFACASRSMQHEIRLMADWGKKSIDMHSSTSFKMLVCGQTIFNVRLHRARFINFEWQCLAFGMQFVVVACTFTALYDSIDDKHYHRESIGKKEKKKKGTRFSISEL
jgi:hypothetical protein